MPADLILLGGRIRPRASSHMATHLAVRAGVVLAVGGEEVLASRGRDTTVVDLQGATLLPGFHDAHAHVVYEGLMRAGLDLRPRAVASVAEVVHRVRERAQHTPVGGWITGFGLAEPALAERRLPDRRDLELAAPNHPVVLDRMDGHIRIANGAALRRAGIDRSTPDPPGGRIDRAGDGEPTGILRDTAMRLVAEQMPSPSLEERTQGVRRALEACWRRGVTSVTAAVGRGFADDLRAYHALARAGDLPVRITMMLAGSHFEAALSSGLRSGFGDRWLRWGPLKLFIDGNFPARTAMLSAAPERGLWRTPPAELRRLVGRAHAHGWPVAMHAIGDRAVAAALDAVAAAIREHGARPLRHRVEHGALCPPALQAQAGRLGVAFCVQPATLYAATPDAVPDVPAAQLAHLLPYRSLARAGVVLAFSSDTPFTADADPLRAIACAVTRTNRAGESLTPSEALSLEAAWGAYTRGGAWAAGEERWKGTLEPGQVADFVAYEQDPWEVEKAHLAELHPTLVGVGGRLRYRGGRSA